MDRLFGVLLILVSAASFGAMPVFARFAYEAGSDPITVLFLKDPITKIKTLALILALAGTMLTIGLDGGGQSLGIILAITAAIIYSVYIIVGSKVIRKADAFSSSAVIMVSAGVVSCGHVWPYRLEYPDYYGSNSRRFLWSSPGTGRPWVYYTLSRYRPGPWTGSGRIHGRCNPFIYIAVSCGRGHLACRHDFSFISEKTGCHYGIIRKRQ